MDIVENNQFRYEYPYQKGDSQESPFFFIFRPKSPIFSHFIAKIKPNSLSNLTT